MLKAIKIRLYPTDEHIIYMNKLFGTSRFIYNQLLNYKINEYTNNKHNVKFGELGKQLVLLKEQHNWIKDSHSKVLQQSIINLNSAYTSFFKKGTGFPKFKAKHDKQSCRFPVDAISKVTGNKLSLIRQLKDIHFKCSRQDEKYLNKNQNLIKSATLSKTKSGKYFVSILTQNVITKQLPQTNNTVGIDLGIKAFVITSDGELFKNLKLKRTNQTKIANLHRQLSRKKKGSNNRHKAKIKLAKYYEKLNNKKENYLHHIVNQLLNENQVIAIETLKVSNMLKNHKLARSLQELSLFRFKEILKYKAKWFNRQIVEIGQFFPSSKLCNHCGYKHNELTLNDRQWNCPVCGQVNDRDLNAAKNILDEGLRILNKKIPLSSGKSTLQESSPLGSRRMKKQNVNYEFQ